MPVLKSVLFGLVTALTAVVLWIVVTFVLPIWIPFLVFRFSSAGIGGATATISSGSLLIAALVGFAAGFSWRYRRLSRHA